MQASNRSRVPGGSWGLPLIGLAGTVAAMLTHFGRLGTEPQSKTVLMSAGAGLIVVGIALLLLFAVTRTRRPMK